jgi:hypothetical protein
MLNGMQSLDRAQRVMLASSIAQSFLRHNVVSSENRHVSSALHADASLSSCEHSSISAADVTAAPEAAPGLGVLRCMVIFWLGACVVPEMAGELSAVQHIGMTTSTARQRIQENARVRCGSIPPPSSG